MAKSKNGGTRAYIRGRIGSDVYSIGKNGKGEKQQVVRSLAETVANPRSQSQMFGRMIMSTIMQAVSTMSMIIDHSFDGVAKGQPSISEFIRRNYALVSADAKAHPASDNSFGMNKYQQKGALAGEYQISAGSVTKPSAVFVNDNAITIGLSADTLTIGGLKAALGLSADGYLTYCRLNNIGEFNFFRAKLTTTLSDETTISSNNVGTLFTFEGNSAVTPSLSGNAIELAIASTGQYNAYGVIVSELIDGVWKHSTCTLDAGDSNLQTADAALPTYPTGNEQFLNGGDL